MGKFGPSRENKLSKTLSEYFERQCYIALDVDEAPAVDVVNQLGAEYFAVSSDYPHSDGAFRQAIEQFLSLSLADDQRRQILWDNCAPLCYRKAGPASERGATGLGYRIGVDKPGRAAVVRIATLR